MFSLSLCSYLGFRIDVDFDWPKVKTKGTGVAVKLSAHPFSILPIPNVVFLNCRCIRSKLDSEGDHLGRSDRSRVHESLDYRCETRCRAEVHKLSKDRLHTVMLIIINLFVQVDAIYL